MCAIANQLKRDVTRHHTMQHENFNPLKRRLNRLRQLRHFIKKQVQSLIHRPLKSALARIHSLLL